VKKHLSTTLTLVIILAMIIQLFFIIQVNAAESLWTPVIVWTNSGDSTVTFSNDAIVKYSGDFSLKISHADYADSYFKKQLTVEENTTYRVSAMVKFEGYELNPNDAYNIGANISIPGEGGIPNGYTGSSWKEIEFEFDSGSRTSVDIALRNGFRGAACKGTAWFSDVKIEKKDMIPTTAHNILALILKNVDVTVKLPAPNGSNYNQRASYSQEDVDKISSVLNRVPNSFKEISGGLMTVGNLDIVPVDTVVTKVTGIYQKGYCLNLDDVGPIMDKYIPNGQYDHIIVILPLGKLVDGWYGLSGGSYKNINFVQVNINPGQPFGLPVFPDAIFIHEILHNFEWKASMIKPTIASLHAAEQYGYNGTNEWIEWYTAYMRNTLPDGNGLPPEVYTVYHGNFTTISTNMNSTIGTAINTTQSNFSNTTNKTANSTQNAVITASNSTIKLGTTFNTINGVTAKDNGGTGTDLTNKISVKGKVNTKKAGTYPITYSVSGANKVKVTKTITVTVTK